MSHYHDTEQISVGTETLFGLNPNSCSAPPSSVSGGDGRIPLSLKAFGGRCGNHA
jgi:hypothetical protein